MANRRLTAQHHIVYYGDRSADLQAVNVGDLVVPYAAPRTDDVETLQVLHRAGYRFDVEALCTWALANGFGDQEVERLREYAEAQLVDGGHRGED